jgi:hypothetical protein
MLECPTCRERQQAQLPAVLAVRELPEILLGADRAAPVPAKSTPTLCLDCGQYFIGTVDCPACHGLEPRTSPLARPTSEAPEIVLPDDNPSEPFVGLSTEERRAESERLLDTLKQIGFDLWKTP